MFVKSPVETVKESVQRPRRKAAIATGVKQPIFDNLIELSPPPKVSTASTSSPVAAVTVTPSKQSIKSKFPRTPPTISPASNAVVKRQKARGSAHNENAANPPAPSVVDSLLLDAKPTIVADVAVGSKRTGFISPSNTPEHQKKAQTKTPPNTFRRKRIARQQLLADVDELLLDD
jgi:hypothetical protein